MKITAQPDAIRTMVFEGFTSFYEAGGVGLLPIEFCSGA